MNWSGKYHCIELPYLPGVNKTDFIKIFKNISHRPACRQARTRGTQRKNLSALFDLVGNKSNNNEKSKSKCLAGSPGALAISHIPYALRSYHSASTSPPSGVTAPFQVAGDTPEDTDFTLPSASRT
jgi:hypothetical protein